MMRGQTLERGRHYPGHHAGSGDFASEQVLSRAVPGDHTRSPIPFKIKNPRYFVCNIPIMRCVFPLLLGALAVPCAAGQQQPAPDHLLVEGLLPEVAWLSEAKPRFSFHHGAVPMGTYGTWF